MSNWKDKGIPKPINEEKTDNKIDLYSIGLSELGLVKNEIEEIGKFFFYMYSKLNASRKDRNIARNPLSMLKGAVSAFATKTFNNIEWREHCASSLREIFHGFSNDGEWTYSFKKIFFENEEMPEELKSLVSLAKLHYSYFSGIDHHEPSQIIGNFQSILLYKGKLIERGGIKLENHSDNDFIEIVNDFFLNIKEIISLLIKERKYNAEN